MAVINVELPLLLVIVAVASSLLVWLLGTFSQFLRNYRYRISLGAVSFSLSGLMGFFSALKLETTLLGDWFSAHPISWLIVIAYCSYLLFGFLGCWTAVRIAGQLDRKQKLTDLYSALQARKKPNAD